MLIRDTPHLPTKRRSWCLCSFMLFVASLALSARAQTDGGLGADLGDAGTGGRNTIQGRIYLPSGRGLDRRVRVRLSSVRGGESSTMSDDNGAFTFRRLTGGTYHVTVEAGKEFARAGETVDILESATRMRRDQPGQTLTVQIQLQLKREEHGTTTTVINAVLASIPRPARELYEQALASARGGGHRKAIELLKRAVALHPDFPLAFNELGTQHHKLGQLDAAADAFRAALKLAPGIFVLHLNYGVLLVQQKKYVEAEAELKRALENDDTSAWAHLYRGRALIGLKRDLEAEKELQLAIKLGGDETRIAHRYLGAIYNERGDDARAIASLETYLRLEPNAKDAGQIHQIIANLRRQQAQTPK